MRREEDLTTELFQSMIGYVRENHKDTIDKAYEYFWVEGYPEDFLRGTALDIAFVNFEDWFIFDFKVNDARETFIDLYSKNNKELTDDALNLLNKIKDTVLSLYEVVSISHSGEILLNDLLMGGEVILEHETLAGGLKKGDIFATRILPRDGKTVMSSCVYPFSERHKEAIIGHIEKEFNRYKKNENPQGTMKSFLKNYGDVFNTLWVYYIRNRTQEKV